MAKPKLKFAVSSAKKTKTHAVRPMKAKGGKSKAKAKK